VIVGLVKMCGLVVVISLVIIEKVLVRLNNHQKNHEVGMDDFINWVKQSPQYPTLIFIHGERLFIRENDVFKVLAVQLAYEAYTK